MRSSALEEDFRRVGADATVDFEPVPSRNNANYGGSGEVLRGAGKMGAADADLEDDEELEDDVDEEDEDDLEDDDDDLEDDEDEPAVSVTDDLEDDEEEKDEEEDEEDETA